MRRHRLSFSLATAFDARSRVLAPSSVVAPWWVIDVCGGLLWVVDDGAIRLHCSSLSQSRFLRTTPIPQRIKGPRNQDLVSAQQINEF
jgi:hypothetical protein